MEDRDRFFGDPPVDDEVDERAYDQDGPDLFGAEPDELVLPTEPVPVPDPDMDLPMDSFDEIPIDPDEVDTSNDSDSDDAMIDRPEPPLALYRRYRPDTFDEVIGQDHVTEPLRRALVNNRVNHAYLFSGPRGCGKTTSARILARCLNCEQGPTPNPCGECQSCRDLARGGAGSIDVIEIDAASHGGVDEARDLRERAFFAPVHSRYKIYIIDEAHMVTTAGFNALLKVVEEPPPHVKFIFATTEPEKVIGTIRSRTHHYPFRLVSPKMLSGYLGRLCVEEGIAVDSAVLPLVVRAGAGSVRDSLSVLDQLLGGAGPQGVDYAHAAALLGYTPDTLLDEIMDAFAAGDAQGVFACVDKVIEVGQDPRRFAEDLLRRLRDLIVVAAVPDALATGLVDVSTDQGERLTTQAAGLGPGELTRAAEVIARGLTEMRGTTAPRLHLELMCARVLLPGADVDARGIHARLDRLERRLNIQPGEVPVPPGPEAPGRPRQRGGEAAGTSDAAPSPAGARPAASGTSESARGGQPSGRVEDSGSQPSQRPAGPDARPERPRGGRPRASQDPGTTVAPSGDRAPGRRGSEPEAEARGGAAREESRAGRRQPAAEPQQRRGPAGRPSESTDPSERDPWAAAPSAAPAPDADVPGAGRQAAPRGATEEARRPAPGAAVGETEARGSEPPVASRAPREVAGEAPARGGAPTAGPRSGEGSAPSSGGAPPPAQETPASRSAGDQQPGETGPPARGRQQGRPESPAEEAPRAAGAPPETAAPDAPTPAPSAPPPAAPAASSPGSIDTAGVRGMWPQVLDAASDRRRLIWIVLRENTQVHSFAGDTLTIVMDNAGARDTFMRKGGADVLRESLLQVIGLAPTIEVVLGEGPPTASPRPAPEPEPAASAAPSPFIEEARSNIEPMRVGPPPEDPEDEPDRNDIDLDEHDVAVDELITQELGAELIGEEDPTGRKEYP